jgi:hypothetical protein
MNPYDRTGGIAMGLCFGFFAIVGALMIFGAAVLPVVCVLAAVSFGLWLVFGVLHLVFRLLGALVLLVLVLPLALVVVLGFGIALLPLFLPFLLVGALIWLVVRASRPRPAPQALPRPS